MVANPFHEVIGILHEHCIVVRVGTVQRIRKPEILPDHNSVTVACVIECIVSGLTYPVSDHRKVHFFVITDGNVIFPRAVTEHRFGKAPVASPPDKPSSVHPNF